MLALAVPGRGTPAVLLAVLLRFNVTPGSLLFTKHPDIALGLITALFIGNFMLLALNIPLAGLFRRVLLLPMQLFMPIVAMLSFVGTYSVAGSSLDVMRMVGSGLLGWVLRKPDVPLVPTLP